MPLPMLQSKDPLPKNSIQTVIAIAAGKGGVGKSCVTVNLALALRKLGFKVGVMDTDIYGPSLRRMLPENQMPEQKGDSIIPANCDGIKLISMAYFRREDEAAVVRAPIANGIIQQFIKNVVWGDLDFLLIDFPPGTGDVQLTLAQHANLTAALMVTTPQEVAVMDVRKAMHLFYQMKVPIVGLIENMSYYLPPQSSTLVYPLGQGGGSRLAEESGFPLLAQIPINSSLSNSGDAGTSIFEEKDPDAQSAAQIFLNLAKTVIGYLKVMQKRQTIEVENIIQKDKHTFSVEWNDGFIKDFRLSDLQRRCPCAGCVESTVRATVHDDLRASSVETVGRYALRFNFNSGCSKGIYSFDFLRQIAEEI